jgi:carbamoyl-phosphate synthase small subunit
MDAAAPKALLMLEDGTCFEGLACAAQGEVFGEICFNTSLVGYLEVISDPSYAGQIITMTYPQIGNYGVAYADLQRESLALRGLVVRDMCQTPSNFRSESSLPDFLRQQGVVAIEQVDTRALTKHIRDAGAMRAAISTIDLDEASLLAKVRASESIVGVNLAGTVSIDSQYRYAQDDEAYDFLLKDPLEQRHHVVAYDCGAKRSILRNLHRSGCAITVVPWDTPAAQVLAMRPDGVFFSNGPGDPETVEATIQAAAGLLGKLPVFGICLGHQMLALAAGASIDKLKFGHRGGNQPVMNLRTGQVEITAQNHGFGVRFSSLGQLLEERSGGVREHPADGDLRQWVRAGIAPVVRNERYGLIQLTHVNLNDGTCEGVAFLDIPAFSVQYHPEASPGPTDSHYLFTAFSRLMDGRDDYLSIDVSADRLAEWR